jgi:hypothetical protein
MRLIFKNKKYILKYKMSVNNLRKPDEKTILFASKISLDEQKPINFLYWNDSLVNKVCIRSMAANEHVIYKDKDEYTSSIQKKFTNKDDAVLCTENSIYIVSNNIKKM